MVAKLKDLEGKYYGTVITVTNDVGISANIQIWDSGDFTPSVRELEKQGYTEKQWFENELVEDGWGEKSPIREVDIICDSHFESKQSYELALEIINKLT